MSVLSKGLRLLLDTARSIRDCASSLMLVLPLGILPVAANAATLNSAVFSTSEAEEAAKANPFLGLHGPYWTPRDEDVAAIKSLLPAYLRRSGFSGKKVLGKLRSYRYQFIGYSDNGQHWVLLNSFCADRWKGNVNWSQEVVFEFDGGDCFFRVRYKVSAHALSGFDVNGES